MVGKVTFVVPVVNSDSALLAEKVITSPPPSVIAFVANVVLSERVKVFPAPKVKVPVPVVMVFPLIVVAFNAPATSKREDGLVVPTPTFPVEPTNRYGAVAGAVPPMPTFPADCK